MSNYEPDQSITNNILKNPNKYETPNWRNLADFPSKKSNVVTQILSHAQKRHLFLVETHATLYHRWYTPKHVRRTCKRHVPHRTHKHHPSVPKEPLQFWTHLLHFLVILLYVVIWYDMLCSVARFNWMSDLRECGCLSVSH